MSVQWITWAFQQQVKPASRKFVLVTLANHANIEGEAYNGQVGIGASTQLDERTVREHLKALEGEGYIERHRRQRRNGSRTSDLIVLDPGRGGTPPAAPTGEKPPNLPGILAAPEPSVEPSAVGEATPKSPERQQTASDRLRGSGDAMVVWEHYVAVLKPRRKEPDQQQLKIIREALKVSEVSECKRAIDGCAASPFHMGQNDNDRKYNSISHILKGKRGGRTTREQIDFFIDIAEKDGGAAGSHVTSGDPARVAQAKRDVLDAHDLPENEDVQEQAKASEEWLRLHGWRIERDTEGRPYFHADGS